MTPEQYRRPLVLSCALLLVVPLLARDKTDAVVMTNGDRFTCEIKGLDSGVLYVSLDYVDGTISIDWSKVARLESSQLFIVKEENGAVYTGTLATTDASGGRPTTLRVTEAPGNEIRIGAAQVIRMGQTSDSFWQRFSGEANLGVIFSKGNESTQFNFASDTEYLTERWLASAYYNSSVSASSGSTASVRNQIDLGTLRLLPRRNHFYAGLATFLQSSEQNIALQSSVGAGIGRYVSNTNRFRLSFIGGLAWQNTRYDRAIAVAGGQNLAAGLIAMDLKYFRFKKTNLGVNWMFLPAITPQDRGRVRFNTNASYYIKLGHDVSWTFSFYGNWDNRPPFGISGSDYGTSSGLSWTYGYK